MKIRSWLVIEPSFDAGEPRLAAADRILIDLTGGESSRNHAEASCAAWVSRGAGPLVMLLPPFASEETEAAAELAVRLGAGSLILSGARSGAEVQRLDVLLRVAEIRCGRRPGNISIMALANAAGVLAASMFQRSSARLHGLGYESSGAALSDTGRLARATIGLAASACGVAAIGTKSPAGDVEAFRAECMLERDCGFAGKLCVDGDQVLIANDVFGNQPPAPVGRTISNTSEPPSA